MLLPVSTQPLPCFGYSEKVKHVSFSSSTFGMGGLKSGVICLSLNLCFIVTAYRTQQATFSPPLTMAVTYQPGRFQPSDFQSGLCSCCDDCSVCKPPLGETPPGAASGVCGAHSVSLTSPLLPPNQASAGPSACRASAAPLPATWTNAACAERRWQCAASTGPDTTSR